MFDFKVHRISVNLFIYCLLSYTFILLFSASALQYFTQALYLYFLWYRHWRTSLPSAWPSIIPINPLSSSICPPENSSQEEGTAYRSWDGMWRGGGACPDSAGSFWQCRWVGTPRTPSALTSHESYCATMDRELKKHFFYSLSVLFALLVNTVYRVTEFTWTEQF